MEEIRSQEEGVKITKDCFFSSKIIKIPRMIRKDNFDIFVVDKEGMEELIDKKFSTSALKAPTKEQLFTTPEL